MKKLLSLIIAAVMLIVALPAVYGADDITVNLDGRKLEFDVQPQIINDRTMVPMRAIFEELGTLVNWDSTTRTVTADKDDTEIIMTIGYELMFVNYNKITLDAPPVIIGDRTLVPLRAIAESLDCKVDWEEETRTVTITTKETAPEVTASPKATASPEATDNPETTDNPEATTDPKATATPSASWQTNSKTGSQGAESSPEATAAPDETDTSETAEADINEENTPAASAAPSETTENSTTDENSETADSQPQHYSGEYNITYDDENEKNSHYCSDFTIIDVTLNDDGDYEITYTVKTYRDDSGNVILSFACYDEDGGRVDGFSELFHTWAYSWTEQEAVAVVSSDTTRIKLLLNE